MTSPTPDQLTDAQRAALDHSANEPLLVMGGPGTGKSTAVGLRAQRLLESGRTPRIIVADEARSLVLAAALNAGGLRIQVQTIHQFLDATFGRLRSGRAITDSALWVDAVVAYAKMQTQTAAGSWALLIDDQHDLPPGLVMLARQIDPSAFVTFDPTVLVEKGRTSAADLRAHLAAVQTLELSLSFRLTGEMARLATALRPEANVPSAASPVTGRVRSFRYPTPQAVGRVAVESLRARPRQRVAVTYRTEEFYRYVMATVRSSPEESRLTTIRIGQAAALRARAMRPGIWILPEWAVHGISFDTVIVTELDRVVDDVTDQAYLGGLYRAVCAASDTVVLGWSRDDGVGPLRGLLRDRRYDWNEPLEDVTRGS